MEPGEPYRIVPRLKKSLAFHLPDGWRGEVVDLSATGLRIQCVAVLEARAEINGELEFPDGASVPLNAVVVWTTANDNAGLLPSEVGLELIDPPPAYHVALAKLFADEE